jgi:hypothetical protein
LNLMYNRYKTETDQKKLENFVLNNKSGYTWDIGLDSTDASYLYFRDLSPAQQRDLGNTYYAKVLFSEFSDYLDDETGLQFVKNFINWTNGSYQIAWISDELTFKNLTVQDQNSLEELLKRASKRFQSKVD